MEIGAKVIEKRDPSAGPMTVTRVTAEGYVVCSWQDPTTRKAEERMFFPEMLEEYMRPER
jgi:uncharacterized protein YodC (DUF2158 family)